MKVTIALLAAVLVGGAAMLAEAADDAAAEALIKKSGCLNCHSVDKKKDGPSYKSVAAKYKGDAEAEKKVVKHLTSNPKVKVDGKEEAHDSPKTKSEADIKNLAAYILSR